MALPLDESHPHLLPDVPIAEDVSNGVDHGVGCMDGRMHDDDDLVDDRRGTADEICGADIGVKLGECTVVELRVWKLWIGDRSGDESWVHVFKGAINKEMNS